MKNPKYVLVDGIRTRYFEAGDGAPIVLVHGGHYGTGSSAEDWELNFDELARDFRVYALDKLGMGFTDNPGNDDGFVIGAQVSHLRGFLDEVGLDSAHLVGHSRGGYPVTKVALTAPDRVRSLVVVDSSSVINPFNPVYNEWRAKAATLDSEQAARYLLRANSFGDEHITDRRVAVEAKIMGLAKTREARQRMQDGLFARFKEDLLARVKEMGEEIRAGRLTVPTLLVWGFEDPSATMERCGIPAMELFMSSVEDCEMHILNHAGHPCFRERPTAFDAVLRNFVDRYERLAVG
ncbi:MAG: alpha/beta fold hydrolase [Propionibacteriales bacterium]|nr:alpha/beta fold hydrolase [Propionibacteriales bacterium]